ncbi:hypothetical protein B566_EDAN001008 [Ephemera danica]|nr:hypothetical protein B566_EDAN001008 [Ephemera danica]
MKCSVTLFILFAIQIHDVFLQSTNSNYDFLLITVATRNTDGFKRFMHSAEVYGVPVKVLGQGMKWEGGDIARFPGGGQKVSLFREEMEKHKEETKKVIMFTDSYDVMVLANVASIMERFEKMSARVVFSAEGFCWPDESLAIQYPPVQRGKRFLNSGAFMGYAPSIYQLVSTWSGGPKDDDQLFYTKQYLDDGIRAALKIKLDHKSEIFQNLNGAVGDVELEFGEEGAFLHNIAYKTTPLVVHGNGQSKQVLNSLSNYLAKAWSPSTGCAICDDDKLQLPREDETWPSVVLAIFIEQATPFLEEFLIKIVGLDYPKSSIHLFIHNAPQYHDKQVDKFLEDLKDTYASKKLFPTADKITETEARNKAITHCVTLNCDFLFVVDAVSHMDNAETLQLLMKQNRPVIAPLITRPYKAWSNFWGALNAEGFYARAADYMQIVKGERR